MREGVTGLPEDSEQGLEAEAGWVWQGSEEKLKRQKRHRSMGLTTRGSSRHALTVPGHVLQLVGEYRESKERLGDSALQTGCKHGYVSQSHTRPAREGDAFHNRTEFRVT